MNEAVIAMLNRHNPRTIEDYDRALREIMQQLCLLGLWRARFFEHAAFYGGTALRLLHGLDRFSEDLDFSLLRPDQSFSLEPYFESLRRELAAFDFDTEISAKRSNAIESAFVKAGTRVHLLKIGVGNIIADLIPQGQVLKVKFEADTNPPPGFSTVSSYILEPVPFSVRAYAPQDLFAGKMHAILFRRWSRRVKGRDWYDLIFFIRNGIPLNLTHLAHRMRQTGHLDSKEPLTEEQFRLLLQTRIGEIDFIQAREDVAPFIRDQSALELFSRDFFSSISSRIICTS